MLPQKKTGARRRPLLALRLRLEAMDHADEERARIGTGRREGSSAALIGWHAAPPDRSERIVLDYRVAEADRRALGEAVVVAEVPLLRTVIPRAYSAAGT